MDTLVLAPTKEELLFQRKELAKQKTSLEVEIRHILKDGETRDCFEIAMIRLIRARNRNEPRRFKYFHGEDHEVRDMQAALKDSCCLLGPRLNFLYKLKETYPAPWDLLPEELRVKAKMAADLIHKDDELRSQLERLYPK